MKNFDVYELDIPSKKENLLKSVLNQKVKQMIRYRLDPKENFSQEYELEDRMAFSLSESALVIEFENGTSLGFGSDEERYSVITWAERYMGQDRLIHGLLKDDKDLFPIMANDKKYSTEFFASIINQTLVRYEIIKFEVPDEGLPHHIFSPRLHYLPREVGLLLIFSNKSQMIVSHGLTYEEGGNFSVGSFTVLEWSQVDKDIYPYLYKTSRFW